jgi:hypothetical protein
MTEILEALVLVGKIVLEPHLAGQLIIKNVGTDNEGHVLHYLHQNKVMLRDYHCRKVITDIIDAMEAR